jgi:hypothetical protein
LQDNISESIDDGSSSNKFKKQKTQLQDDISESIDDGEKDDNKYFGARKKTAD